jgi:hypothetical protein
MTLLKSGTIKDIEEKDDRFIFHFSLYHENTNIPGSVGLLYAKSNLFEKITYKYFIREFEKDIEFGFFDAHLVMVCNFSFDKPTLYLVIPKKKKLLTK